MKSNTLDFYRISRFRFQINFVLYLALALVLGTVPIYAEVLNVPDDYGTIQEAIDAASDGDSVLVAAGEYVENINFNGRNISVIGDTDCPGNVVIDGNEDGSVVTFENGETADAILEGFTIQNGSGQYFGGIQENTGGGIFCLNSSPTLRNLLIAGNNVLRSRAYSVGGGISMFASNSLLMNIEIVGNTAGLGGGMLIGWGGTPILRFVMVHNNQAIVQEYQWGSSGSGGGLVCSADATFEHCVIYENTAGRYGGGMHFDGLTTTIQNLTITGNSAPYGAGIWLQGTAAELVNTICWANDGNEIQFRDNYGDPTLSVIYSDIDGGEDAIIGNGDVTWGEGNIDADPLFVDAENGDYHLTADSPCIDAGTDVGLPYEGEAPDMGAYYFHQERVNHPEIDWSRTFGGGANDVCHDVTQTSDGGYALAGYTHSYGNGEQVLLVKTDANGDELWRSNIGWGSRDLCNSMLEKQDGGFLLVGFTHSLGAGSRDMLLIDIDDEGNVVDPYTYGGGGWDQCSSIQPTEDGGYILSGWRNFLDAWIVKISDQYEVQWSRTFGQNRSARFFDAIQTEDGGYAMVGTIQYGGSDRHDFWLLKTDSEGNFEWEDLYGGNTMDIPRAFLQTDDNGFLMAGKMFGALDGGGSGANFGLVKTDSLGNQEWMKSYGGEGTDDCQDILRMHDGGYVLAGLTYSFGAGPNDMWLLRVDACGDSIWSETFGGDDRDVCKSLGMTDDGGFILGGATNSFGAGNYDFWMIKTGPEGETPPPAEPNIIVTPAAINFGEVEFRRSAELTFTVLNDGNANLTVSNIAIEGDYYSMEFDGEFMLEPEADSTFGVIFIPNDLDELPGLVTIYSDDSDEPEVPVELTGIGLWVTPQELLERLIQQVILLREAGEINRGQCNGLVVKLEHPIARLNRGQIRPAINQINAFVSHVIDFMEDEVLTAEQGQPLIDEAEFIIALINDYGVDGPKVREALLDKQIPAEYFLDNCYPNPFNAKTMISFGLPENSQVKLTVYDSFGRLVTMLADEEFPAGVHDITWNAIAIPAGVYLIRITTAGQIQTIKAALIK